MSSSARGPDTPPSGRPLLMLEVVGVATALGVLTSFAQGWLPDELGSLANSIGPWAAVAVPARAAGAATGAGRVVGALSSASSSATASPRSSGATPPGSVLRLHALRRLAVAGAAGVVVGAVLLLGLRSDRLTLV